MKFPSTGGTILINNLPKKLLDKIFSIAIRCQLTANGFMIIEQIVFENLFNHNDVTRKLLHMDYKIYDCSDLEILVELADSIGQKKRNPNWVHRSINLPTYDLYERSLHIDLNKQEDKWIVDAFFNSFDEDRLKGGFILTDHVQPIIPNHYPESEIIYFWDRKNSSFHVFMDKILSCPDKQFDFLNIRNRPKE